MNKIPMDKRTKVALIVVFATALIGGALSLVVALTNNDDKGAETPRQELLSTPTTLPVETTTTSPPAPVASTTTIANSAFAADGSLITVAPRPKEAEPKQVVIRTPVRCPAGGAPTTGSLPGDSANGSKRWVTVSRLAGSCDLEGSRFALKGVDTRLAFRSDASNFNAFVIDSKTGIQGTAGFPHAQCSGPCADSDFLTDPAGQYSLRVQADGGPWELLIQEYR